MKKNKGKWLVLVLTEERIWLMGSGKRRAMKKHYRHWCTLDKDTYGRYILWVRLVKEKDYHDTCAVRRRVDGRDWDERA